MSKKIITNKQKIILTLLYTFRFVNSKQIQELLGHKDHRRINSWLKDLVEKGYIERDFTPVFGTLTKPAIYYLTAKGRKYIKSAYTYHFPKYLKRIARDNKASKAFRIRCQIIVDWYLLLFSPGLTMVEKDTRKNTSESKTGIEILDYLIHELTIGKKEEAQIDTIHFFTPANFPDFILIEKMKPDAYVQRRITNDIIHGFHFVFDAYIPRFLLKYTLKRIFDTLDYEYWEDETINSLHIFFLCPNHQIIIYIQRLLPS
ncbi:MAG: replication-relaxation family protein, partial [Patescibacteria group bacterium]|nr:replication-relaxation family protein [Patescibacteria group bacterium]